MVSLLNIDSEMLPSAILWFLFLTLTDWFVDNELSVHFGYFGWDKTKSILSSSKHWSKTIGQKDISYKDVLDVLDECLTGDSMAM